jgi:hypothetical protein
MSGNESDLTGSALKRSYGPTSHERLSAKASLARSKNTLPGPRVKVSEKDGVTQITPDHPDLSVGHALLMEALGTTDAYFVNGLLGQLANVGTQGPAVDERGINFMLAVVKGVEPKDQVEAMLAAQMAAVHNATMSFARRLAHVENINQQDSAERAFNRLARTFAAQVESLKRYRTGGEQKVTVQHVTVNDGGQAIVGNVKGGRDNDQNRGQPRSPGNAGAITFAPGTTLPSADKEREAVPVASGRR